MQEIVANLLSRSCSLKNFQNVTRQRNLSRIRKPRRSLKVEGREEGTSSVITTDSAMIDDAWAMVCSYTPNWLSERAREKERRATNKLLKEAEVSVRGTPISDSDSRES
ncbi:hypothetical protein M378DRAFT_818418 [Amanita muscaria Koide BX008]|uniref:Uncharacterized protein n=1 Tax=Amanita muscaria (strain Koide BX008) TaxID=946122 RepID=A0A0C2WZI2_AMAMK|nr:hypothetical protein M378DRAFT_818418 [Amanita muscaria Koide BX008]